MAPWGRDQLSPEKQPDRRPLALSLDERLAGQAETVGVQHRTGSKIVQDWSLVTQL